MYTADSPPPRLKPIGMECSYLKSRHEICFKSLINSKDPDPEPQVRLIDPDPGGHLITDPSNPDRDPQPCFRVPYVIG
jgi:hypothetical protein